MAIVFDRIEDRLDMRSVICVAAREMENRHVVRESLRRARESVFGSRSYLRRENTDAVAVGGTTKTIGDRHPDAFLPADYGSYADLGAGVNQRLCRVDREEFDSFASQHLGNRVDSLHGLSPFDLRTGSPSGISSQPPSRLKVTVF